MSCNRQCPQIVGKTTRHPKHRLDAVRRKLEFSDEVGEGTPPSPPPANKYEHFKKVSESHSSHIMEPPIYSPDMVPESFLEAFGGKRDVPVASVSKRKTPVLPCPPCDENYMDEMPGSFLDFCQERLAARPAAPKTPPKRTPPKRPTSVKPCYVQSPIPYNDSSASYASNASYYDYIDPNADEGMIFDPSIMSTPCSPKRSPAKTPHPGYYYPPPFKYYTQPPGYVAETPYIPPRQCPAGIGKHAYPASHSPVTPPTPASACGVCAQSGSYDSTVSSGDFMFSSTRKDQAMASYRYPTPPRGAVGIGKYACPASRSPTTPPSPASVCTGPCAGNHNNAPPGHSPPLTTHFKYQMSMRKEMSSTSLSDMRRQQSDTVCTDDLFDEKSSPRCPILGVTPVHSAASMSSSAGNLGCGNMQNISGSIEKELSAREAQERCQLENDLLRWQQARRKLVMNTASMGS